LNDEDDKFNHFIADLLDEEELELLKKIVRNRGEFVGESDV
jgi:hypothetical protein